MEPTQPATTPEPGGDGDRASARRPPDCVSQPAGTRVRRVAGKRTGRRRGAREVAPVPESARLGVPSSRVEPAAARTVGPRWLRSRWTAWILLAACVGLTFAVWGHSLADRDASQRRRDREHQAELTDALTTQLGHVRSALAGAHAWFDAGTGASGSSLASYTAVVNLMQREPGVLGIGFVQAGPGGRMTVTNAEPAVLADTIDGVDVGAVPGATAALDHARDLGDVTFSDSYTFDANAKVRIGSGGGAFAAIAPVYTSPTVPAELPARRAELRGWAIAVVDAQAFLQSVVARTPGFERVALYDGATTSAAKAMAHVPTAKLANERPAPTRTMRVTTVDGHTWTVQYRAFFDTEDPEVASTRALLLYAGLALSFLVFVIAQIVRRSETRAQRLVNEATESLRASEAWFQAIVQSSSDIFFVVDDDGVIRYASPAFEWMLGYPRHAAVGWNITTLVHPDDRERAIEAFAQFAEGRLNEPCRCRAGRADGTWVDVEAVASNLTRNPAIGGHVISVRDVTERRKAATALAEAQELFRIAFEEAPIGMCITDVEGVVMRANHSLGRILGYTPEALVGVRMADLTHPDDVAMSQAELARLKETGVEGYRIEKRYIHRDGRTVWTSLSVSLVRDADGNPLYTVGQTEDITERKAIADRLAHAAIHDPLTGLPNRVLFMDRLQHALTRAERRGTRVGVVFLDLDRFKLVNDSLGHTAGDRLLVAVADRLRGALRPSDTVARFGGDEFVVLCDDVLGEDATVEIASRMAHAVARPVLLPEGEVFVTASIGVAVSGRPGDSADNLLRDADTAMYRAKDQGRARTEVFDERTHDRAVHHLRTGNDLHRALQRGEFEVHYQPVVDLETGRVSGFEALVRWQHPTRGLVHPGDFISLAEETGLIVPLGAWVLEEACRQVVEWQHHRPAGARPLTISVNLSPRQLAEPTLHDEVTRILAETGIDPDAVWLEITESTLMHDAESAVSTLRALRLLGVHLSVDDFGTGYSSLSYLKRFPVEALKVDRSFVDGLGHEPGDSAIVTAVVTMAHALGLRAVAEGLETPVQLGELRTLGCDMAQGFLFGVPRSAADLGDHPADDLSTWQLADAQDAHGGERRAG